ncbi:GntR family transcriptional regulator [Ktedonosporobacter rubrisoli]|uniref:GntR family transcriptional regulator n=1 Tax=Ktedonosporobacter rubrisoli TaxID=2509675 RepID=A0A4P6JML3_KTERU|nr:GntR family transcriptional regulator [Ktedonosporobacter rubrisoli]QBD76474.1 GntR family transcriptional regulator [Ktedonosporobacter rubrisoli]
MKRQLRPFEGQKAPGYREAAYHAIKEAILSGDFGYGQALIEEEIATRLQMSRTPIREALAILQHEGLIAPRNGRGFHVREMTNEEFIALFVANEVVEPYLVRRAALLASAAQLGAMEDAITFGKQCASSNDVPGILRSGRDFHRAVGMAADNQPLMDFVVNNEERTDLYLLSYVSILDTTRMGLSNQEHEAIFQAIKQRDPEAAARLVAYHSQSVRDRFSPFFNAKEFQKVAAVRADE